MKTNKLLKTMYGLVLIALVAISGLAVSCGNGNGNDNGNLVCDHIYGEPEITPAGYHDSSKDECRTGTETKECLQCEEPIISIIPCLGTQELVFEWYEETNDAEEYWDNELGQMVVDPIEYPVGWVVTSNTGNRALDVVCIPNYWDDSSIHGKQPVSSIGLEAFGNRDFIDPSGVNSVTIGANVTVISNHAFHACGSLETVTFAAESKLETIGEAAFRYSKLKSIIIPASVITIEDSAFQSNDELTTITFATGSQLKTIGPSAFANTEIESISIPASVTSIGDAAFRGCENLKNITISASVTSIGDRAFLQCINLNSVTVLAVIPPELGDYVFYTETWGGTLFEPTIEYNIIPNLEIKVPAGSLSDYKGAPRWGDYEDIIDAM